MTHDPGRMRAAEQIAEEMASEMRRRFGIKATDIVKTWLARCIMEARHELAFDMHRVNGPPHSEDEYDPWLDRQ